MVLVAEIRTLDDAFEVHSQARLLITATGSIEVIELGPHGGKLAHSLLEDPLVDPFGRTVTSDASGADFVRTLRWYQTSDRLWVTTLVELPDDRARDPATILQEKPLRHMPATVPFPEQPAGLSDVEIVEIRRPLSEDYVTDEVVARLVEISGGSVQVEGPDPASVRRVEVLLDRAGRPSLAEIMQIPIRDLAPGLAPRPVNLESPGDAAWRDGLVGTRRLAAARGDRAAVARLDLEFETLLPRIWLSRCPFTGKVLRLAIDGYGFDGPFWDPAAPLRPTDDLPATFLGLAGAVVDDEASGPDRIRAEAIGAGRVPVFAFLATDPGVRAVLSTISVGGRRCDLVAYFTRPRPGGPPRFREWGTRLARVPDDPAWHWVPGPATDPPTTTDLEPLLRTGQLSWIRPFCTGVELRAGPDGCPWLLDGE
jgi:hypothetical protein